MRVEGGEREKKKRALCDDYLLVHERRRVRLCTWHTLPAAKTYLANSTIFLQPPGPEAVLGGARANLALFGPPFKGDECKQTAERPESKMVRETHPERDGVNGCVKGVQLKSDQPLGYAHVLLSFLTSVALSLPLPFFYLIALSRCFIKSERERQ